MSTATAEKFVPGDRVRVANGHAYAGQEVTVVRYWRNGYFIVREDRFQTTCAVDVDKLTRAEDDDSWMDNHPGM
jgi:hypothetical protein